MRDDAKWAKDRAVEILGPRATVYRDRDGCVVARREMLVSGMQHVKVYGQGDTWADALAEAQRSYAYMRANPNVGVRDDV
jgi:hypothetical protein